MLLIITFIASWITALTVHKYVEKPLMKIGNHVMQTRIRKRCTN